jgi:hypothetical protein
MYYAGDLHKVHLPINLKVNPDRTTAIAMEKKTGSRKAAKGFFLVQGIAVVLKNMRKFFSLKSDKQFF